MHVLYEMGLVCLLLGVVVECSQKMTAGEDPDQPDVTVNRRSRRNVESNSNPLEQLVNALQSDSTINRELYMPYTPSTPAPDNIDCYVEVPTTARRGGRCIQLGDVRRRDSRNRPWACQAGIHLALNSECQSTRGGGRHGIRGGRG